jgi:hypothetical protein
MPEEVNVPLPGGFVLDPEVAAARYSKKKRQLIIVSPQPPRPSASLLNTGNAASTSAAVPETQKAANAEVSSTLAPPSASKSTMGQSAADCSVNRAEPAVEEDEDDDDMPPPLEAARSAPSKAPSSDLATELQEVAAATSLSPEDLADTDHTNEAATALMEKALAAREQKRKETEDARRKADLASGGCLKKGFFSSGKEKKVTQKQRPSPAVAKDAAEEIPFISGSADPEAAKRDSLKLPEVQQALQQGAQKLKEDQSWVTPQLLQALASRPDLSKAMSDPKIQEAMRLMQTDPEAAKLKYKDDAEVTKFLKDFTGLMATHFEVLSNEAPDPRQKSQPTAENQKPIQAPITGLDLAAKPPPAVAPPSNGEKLPTEDPQVLATLQDPEVQALIGAIRAGQPLELHEVGRNNPRLFMKVKILLDNGLLAMQH